MSLGCGRAGLTSGTQLLTCWLSSQMSCSRTPRLGSSDAETPHQHAWSLGKSRSKGDLYAEASRLVPLQRHEEAAALCLSFRLHWWRAGGCSCSGQYGDGAAGARTLGWLRCNFSLNVTAAGVQTATAAVGGCLSGQRVQRRSKVAPIRRQQNDRKLTLNHEP